MVFGFHLHHHNQEQSPQVPPPHPQQQQHIQQQQYSTANISQNTYRSVLYFCNWAIYGRKHFPKDVPADRVSHILYAFANVTPDTGEVVLSDKWADTDIVLEGDSWNDPQTYLKGCFNQFFKIKQKNRHLKLMLSIGGWTYSSNVANGANTPEKRKKFATSSVALLKDLGIDGIDVDWEYPQNDEEAANYVDLLRQIRLELDSYALRIGVPRGQFELSVAAPAGPQNYRQLKISEMDQFLDFWNIMCYDYAGAWSQTSQYQSNLYGGELNTDTALNYYRTHGVSPHKLIMGMPIYGRAFANTDGIGHSFNGVGEGSWEAGCWDYKALPLPGSAESEDMQVVAASCYDSSKRLLVVYENEKTTAAKADYVRSKGLGGVMWWESSADHPIGSPRSLVGTFTHFLGPHNLDKKQNCLYYPESSHDNIKNVGGH